MSDTSVQDLKDAIDDHYSINLLLDGMPVTSDDLLWVRVSLCSPWLSFVGGLNFGDFGVKVETRDPHRFFCRTPVT